MSDKDVSSFKASMPNSFSLEKARGMKANVQFSFSGEDGGEWIAKINDGQIAITEGKIEEPDLIIKVDIKIAELILTGELDGMQAFTTGKIQLEGDLDLAMKLMDLFN
ncbi:MAG: SCP2 sterol-binding domain-containing protein [Anaerolineaceae bacterium]